MGTIEFTMLLLVHIILLGVTVWHQAISYTAKNFGWFLLFTALSIVVILKTILLFEEL